MNARMNAGRLVPGLVAVALLAGCAASPAATSSRPAVTSPSSVPESAAPAVPTQPATPDRVLVSGEMTCVLIEPSATQAPPSATSPTPEPTEAPPGSVYIEHDLIDCTYAMSDPRVSGTERFDSQTSVVDLPDLPGGVRMWDNVPLTLTAEGGTWKGCTAGSEFYRSTAARLWTLGSTRYEGQGAFEGLVYTLNFAREAKRGDEPYLVSGWIEPASPADPGGCIVP